MLIKLITLFSLFNVYWSSPLKDDEEIQLYRELEVINSWNTSYFDMPINHFDITDRKTFKLKYITNEEYYKTGGPILFYTGNEGPIESFATSAGIIFDIANLFNAYIVFAEHRFYGESLPFGKQTFNDADYMKYLSIDQVLEDFATVIRHIKEDLNVSENTAVISIGGSYGGMLSTWFRMKYPHLVDGAWAASAPLLSVVGGKTDCDEYNKIATRTFLDAGCDVKTIQDGWNALYNYSKTEDGLNFLNDLFVIDPISTLKEEKDIDYLIEFISEAIFYLSMLDYPYATNFLMDLPRWPTKGACSLLKKTDDLSEQAFNMYSIVNFIYNSTGSEKSFCVNPVKCDLAILNDSYASKAWSWQECTEMFLPFCKGESPKDFFPTGPKNVKAALEAEVTNCLTNFAKEHYSPEYFKPNFIIETFGDHFGETSKIIFTNGALDPWSGGGVYSISPEMESTKMLYTFKMQGAAHHLDLRTPNTCDPPPVHNARFQIVNILSCWIYPNECKTVPRSAKLPSLHTDQPDKCESIHHGYPWHQRNSLSKFLIESVQSLSNYLQSDATITLFIDFSKGSSRVEEGKVVEEKSESLISERKKRSRSRRKKQNVVEEGSKAPSETGEPPPQEKRSQQKSQNLNLNPIWGQQRYTVRAAGSVGFGHCGYEIFADFEEASPEVLTLGGLLNEDQVEQERSN